MQKNTTKLLRKYILWSFEAAVYLISVTSYTYADAATLLRMFDEEAAKLQKEKEEAVEEEGDEEDDSPLPDGDQDTPPSMYF